MHYHGRILVPSSSNQTSLGCRSICYMINKSVVFSLLYRYMEILTIMADVSYSSLWCPYTILVSGDSELFCCCVCRCCH